MTVDPLDFSSDRPLTGREQDRLNRTPFAQRITTALLGLPKGAGLVVGVHGPWGDGKTTVLNLLRADLDNSNGTVTLEFNPWRFTDEAAMLAAFFSVLAGTIRAKLTTRGEEIAAWVEKVGRYAAVVNDRFGAAADIAAAKAGAGLEDLRGRLFEVLAESDKRIVVLVDDIDRLDKHETHTLFRLIKACADFPNVCYVLAFDDTAVAKALGERYGAGDEQSGRAFLEKIIQVPLKLPVAAKEDLRALCFEHINSALAAAGVDLTREQVGEFIAGFDRGVAVRLTTPRAAKRYGNGLLFVLPMLKGETNLVDLLLIEALRAFFPEVYDIVRENHTHFSGVEPDRHTRGAGSPRSAQLLRPPLDSMPGEHADAVKALLTDLFPRVGSAFGGSNYGSDSLSRWSREQRISSPEYCLRYFSYAVPRNDIPDVTITGLLAAATNGDTALVEATLTANLAGPKARRVIEKLRALESTADPRAAEILASVIPGLGKSIPNPPALFDFAEAPAQAAILISHLLRRIPDRARRVAVAKRVMTTAEPLWFGVECIRWLYVTDKPEKQDANTLNEAELTDVRRVLVDRIRSYATAGAPLFDPDASKEKSLLFEWWRAEGRDPVQRHLEGVFKRDPAQVARFLRSQTPLAWSDGAVLPRVSDLGADQLKAMKLIIDLATLAKWVREHCPGDFNNPEWHQDDAAALDQRLAEQFMFIYNKWTRDGEPPDAQSGSEDRDSQTKGRGQSSGDVTG